MRKSVDVGIHNFVLKELEHTFGVANLPGMLFNRALH